jgi:hypothetical protein
VRIPSFTKLLAGVQLVGAGLSFALGAPEFGLFLLVLSSAILMITSIGDRGEWATRLTFWLMAVLVCIGVSVSIATGAVEGSAAQAVLFLIAAGGAGLATYGVWRRRPSGV